jgi:hypothetical protein
MSDEDIEAVREARAPGVPGTRAMVLHPDIRSAPGRREPQAALAEAVALAAALPGLEIVGAEVVGLPRAQPGRLFGKGKLAELKARIAAAEVELVLVDGPVTPVQQRNLEKDWGVKLLDRTGLILEIFADRARTREGVLQVELAALSYQPRGWCGPGPIWSGSAAASALSAVPARPRSRPTGVPSTSRWCGCAGSSRRW